MALLAVQGLTRTVHDGSTVVWANVGFTLNDGEVLLVQGPSGAGKTLLLRCLAALDTAGAGSVLLNGKLPSAHGLPAWRCQVMYVSQSRITFPGTPSDLYWQAQQLSAQSGRARGDLPALVHALGLEQAALNQAWSELSGGQAQRLALAIAIALRPSVLLVDEPTSACDALSAQRVEQVLFGCGAAVVWVTHDMSLRQRLPVPVRMLELPLGSLASLPATAPGLSAGPVSQPLPLPIPGQPAAGAGAAAELLET